MHTVNWAICQKCSLEELKEDVENLNVRYPKMEKYIKAISAFQISNPETWNPPKEAQWDSQDSNDVGYYISEMSEIANNVYTSRLNTTLVCPAKTRARNIGAASDLDVQTITVGDKVPRLCDYSLEHIISNQK